MSTVHELTEKSRAVMVPANSMGTYLPSPWISRSPSRFRVKSLTRVTSTTTSFKFTSENCKVGSVISSNDVMLFLLKKESTYISDTCIVHVRVCGTYSLPGSTDRWSDHPERELRLLTLDRVAEPSMSEDIS